MIEVTASGAAQWRLRADLEPVRRARVERSTLRIIGWSFLALAGVALNALLGWSWADPIAALAMVPIIAREGVEGVRARDHCDC